jgi:hypothetical protein
MRLNAAIISLALRSLLGFCSFHWMNNWQRRIYFLARQARSNGSRHACGAISW